MGLSGEIGLLQLEVISYVYLSSTNSDTINLGKLPEKVVRGVLFMSSEAVM